MSVQFESNTGENQPQITTHQLKRDSQNKNKENSFHKENNPQNDYDKEKEIQKSKQVIKQLRKKHPQCIPIFFVKHYACPKQFPAPKIPFILFKKDFKIQQAMYSLYNQIQIKPLYFFCTRWNKKENKTKYVMLKPGETIEQIFNKYGQDGYLTLIYGDKNIGLGGVNKMQKWLIRVLIFLGIIWGLLYGYPLFLLYESGGLPAVWNTLSSSIFGKDRHNKQSVKVNNASDSNVKFQQQSEYKNSQKIENNQLINQDQQKDQARMKQDDWKQVQNMASLLQGQKASTQDKNQQLQNL